MDREEVCKGEPQSSIRLGMEAVNEAVLGTSLPVI